jgi:hypothetical protein
VTADAWLDAICFAVDGLPAGAHPISAWGLAAMPSRYEWLAGEGGREVVSPYLRRDIGGAFPDIARTGETTAQLRPAIPADP